MPQDPPHFHGAELRKIADERRWDRVVNKHTVVNLNLRNCRSQRFDQAFFAIRMKVYH
jgi:hypothetical protein